MKTVNRKFIRLLACVLTLLLAFSFAVPVFAEDSPQITIHNANGLPAMENGQFTAYQIFTGTPNKEGAANKNDWGATEWNNWSLADIKWGSDISTPQTLITALTTAGQEKWPEFYKETANVFKDLSYDAGKADASAEALAKILAENNTNAFLQAFSEFVVHGANRGEAGAGFVSGGTASKANKQDTPEKDTSTITVPATGYYLVAEKHPGTEEVKAVESEFILAVLGNQDINLKADIPDVDKDIVVGEETAKGDEAGVGDSVTFRLTGSVAKDIDIYDTYKYVFTDTLSKGLTYQYDAKVYLQRGGVKYEIPNGFTIAPNTTPKPEPIPLPSSDTQITITFDDLKKIAPTGLDPFEIQGTDKIVVEYTAILNENSVIGSKGNPNKVYLDYANNPHADGTGRTEEKTVYVYAFGLDIKKIGSDKSEGLAGAGFVLKKGSDYAIFEDQYILKAADGTETFYASQEEANEANTKAGETGTVTGPVRRLTGWTSADSNPSTTQVKGLIDAATNLEGAKASLANYLLESGVDGAIPDIYGLDVGDYALEEFIVPAGYNSPEKDFDIKIEASIDSVGKLQSVTYSSTTVAETKTYTEADDGMAVFSTGLLPDSIENQKAPLLPFTGGIGTTIFYVLGLALIGGAVTYLVIASKKRKKADENA